MQKSGFLQNKKEKERGGKLNEWKDTQELILFGDFFSLTVVCLSSCHCTVLQTIVLASLPSQDVINYYYWLLLKPRVCFMLYIHRIWLLGVLDLEENQDVGACAWRPKHIFVFFLQKHSWKGKTHESERQQNNGDPNTWLRALSHLLIATCSQACQGSHMYFTASLLELHNELLGLENLACLLH